jgi:prophage regulatory protein
MEVEMYDQLPVTELSIMRLPEVAAVCGKSRAAIYKAIRKGEFPKQIKLSARASGWVRCEIEEWVKARMAAR